MQSAPLSVKAIYKSTWKTLKAHLLFILAVIAITSAIQFPINFFKGYTSNEILALILTILSWLASSVIAIGLINTFLNLIDTNTRQFPYLYNKIHLFLQYIIASSIFGIIITLGFILLIVPGIIWAIQFQFYSYLIVDKNLNFKQALKQSKALTKGYKKKLFLLGASLLFLNLLGLLAFGYGTLLTIPLSTLILAHTYRVLNPHLDTPQEEIKPVPPESEVFIENPEETINPTNIVDEPPPIISPEELK